MKNTVVGSIAIGCVIALSVVTADAQVPSHITFTVAGTSNFMDSPVLFDGSVTGGEPLLAGGYWTIEIDDTGWPGTGDKQVRWDYIAATYFAPNYDAMFGSWTATFDENTTNSAPLWATGAVAGSLMGTATLQLTISDFNFDAVIDPVERGLIIFSGTLIVVKNGTGVFAGYCGLGSYSAVSENSDPENWADDEFDGSVILDVEDCSVPVEDVSWGYVKALYQ